MPENDFIETIMLSVSFMGFVIFVIGMLMFVWRDHVAGSMHFILPIPPIGVAAYVFVYNLFGKYNGNLSQSINGVVKDILWATLISSTVFIICTILVILLVIVTKEIF